VEILAHGTSPVGTSLLDMTREIISDYTIIGLSERHFTGVTIFWPLMKPNGRSIGR
jgi:hypothetical protein